MSRADIIAAGSLASDGDWTTPEAIPPKEAANLTVTILVSKPVSWLQTWMIVVFGLGIIKQFILYNSVIEDMGVTIH